MSSRSDGRRCGEAEQVALYALSALTPDESSAFEAHLARCAECRTELESLRETVNAFADWPTDVLRPTRDLWHRIADRIATQSGGATEPQIAPEPDWEDVAPGISCKLLATDTERHRVSMLVRLAPGVAYPPHRHAGIEELHLLDGELWIGERKLRPGDYNRAEPGTSDTRVWSETGCTCVLITSTRDAIT